MLEEGSLELYNDEDGDKAEWLLTYVRATVVRPISRRRVWSDR